VKFLTQFIQPSIALNNVNLIPWTTYLDCSLCHNLNFDQCNTIGKRLQNIFQVRLVSECCTANELNATNKTIN